MEEQNESKKIELYRRITGYTTSTQCPLCKNAFYLSKDEVKPFVIEDSYYYICKKCGRIIIVDYDTIMSLWTK